MRQGFLIFHSGHATPFALVASCSNNRNGASQTAAFRYRASANFGQKSTLSQYFLKFLRLFALVSISVNMSVVGAKGFDGPQVNLTDEPIQPLPQIETPNQDYIDLGERLFFDTRLSGDKNISCASCHNFTRGGADNKNFSLKGNGRITQFNTPSIFNVVFNSDYYWSGKFDSLELEMENSVSNLNTNWSTVLARLKSLPEYQAAFGKIFKNGITIYNIQLCLVSFEKSLITPNSRFDQYLSGNPNALSETEISGYNLFKSYGCIACHQGVNIGGNISIRASELSKSYGTSTNFRTYKSFSSDPDTLVRVPSLRNVAQTAPYFHDGSVMKLETAVAIEGRLNSHSNIPDTELTHIVQFLNSLTGQYKGHQL